MNDKLQYRYYLQVSYFKRGNKSVLLKIKKTIETLLKNTELESADVWITVDKVYATRIDCNIMQGEPAL